MLKTFALDFFFPTVQQGDQVILTCIHYNYIFSPPFVLLQHKYLDTLDFFNKFYWSIIDLTMLFQFHVYSKMNQLYTYIYIHSLSDSFPIFFFFFQGHTCGIWKFPQLARGQIGDCSHWPTAQPQPRRIQAMPSTYTTAHSNAGSPTH